MTATTVTSQRAILRDERTPYCFGDASFIVIKDALRLGLVYWSEADRGWRRMYPDSVRAEQAALEKALGAGPGVYYRTPVTHTQPRAWQRRRR